MDKIAFIYVLAACFTIVIASIKIVDLKVPDALENGKEQNVILDCDFEVEESEPGLSVKWFYEGEEEQVYQWIPGIGKPIALGILKDRVDLDYKATSENLTMYRALKIKDLSPKLTGTYTCQVSSFFNEAIATKKMIIYQIPQEPEMEHDEENNAVFCAAYGLYPKPNMTIFIENSNDTIPIEDAVIVKSEDDYFNISAILNYTNYELYSPTKFICEISYPETPFTQRTMIEFWPGGEPTTQETVTENTDLDYPTNATYIESADNLAANILPSWTLTTTIIMLWMSLLTFF